LVKSNKEKEQALEKTKSDLEAKRRKIEEEKQNTAIGSDRESTISSLTASSDDPYSGQKKQRGTKRDREHHNHHHHHHHHRHNEDNEDNHNPDGNDDDNSNSSGNNNNKKQALNNTSNNGDNSNNQNTTSSSNQESSHSSSANSSGDSRDGPQREGKSVSVNQMTSSLSDVTDSKGSSSEGNSSGRQQQQQSQPQPDDVQPQKQESTPPPEECKPEKVESSAATLSNPNPGSILSDAAVADGVDAHEEVATPAGTVVITATTSRTSSTGPSDNTATSSSQEESNNNNYTSSFDLDYKEVFVKSNVPQLLATTSGRIVAWNDFFLRATGLSAQDAGRLTIFSLVRSSKLSSLFEIVAAALRIDDTDRGQRTVGSGGSSNNNAPSVTVTTDSSSTRAVTDSSPSRSSGNERHGNASSETTTSSSSKVIAHQPQGEGYAAITLPCTMFHTGVSAGGVTGSSSSLNRRDQQLYMTVTLMTDEDPQKRCFHCVLTDCPGTNGGNVGMISRDLLAELITDPNKNAANHHGNHKRKRNIQGFA
jgi:hypothetical protein